MAFQRVATQISVADLDRSTRFYCDGLGFKEGPSSGMQVAEPGSEIAKMLGMPSARFQSRILLRSDGNLEMIQYYDPTPQRDPTSAAPRVGATGMLFNCPDAPSAAARLVELGGTLTYGGKDGATGQFHSYFVFDPDGIRIQLTSLPEEVMKQMMS